MGAIVITRLTFLESVRRRIALAAFVLGVAFLVLYGIGFHYIYEEAPVADTPQRIMIRNQVLNFIATAGLYAVNFLAVIMAALVSADTLAGEISSGTVQTIASKPIGRGEIVMGKWLGFAALMAAYLVLMAGGVIGIVYLQSGYLLRNLPAAIGIIYLETLMVMSVSIACSTTFSTLATGGIVFGLYGIAFIGGWVEQIGAMIRNTTAINIGIFSSLLFPSEALWKRACFEMSSPLVQSLGMAAGPFGTASVPSPLMVLYGGLYAAAALFFAIRRFSKRDL